MDRREIFGPGRGCGRASPQARGDVARAAHGLPADGDSHFSSGCGGVHGPGSRGGAGPEKPCFAVPGEVRCSIRGRGWLESLPGVRKSHLTSGRLGPIGRYRHVLCALFLDPDQEPHWLGFHFDGGSGGGSFSGAAGFADVFDRVCAGYAAGEAKSYQPGIAGFRFKSNRCKCAGGERYWRCCSRRFFLRFWLGSNRVSRRFCPWRGTMALRGWRRRTWWAWW